MPTPTLIATPGATDANSYLTVAEANTYHDARLHASDWSGATTDQKTVALIHATRVLDNMYDWTGYATTLTQALQWPRQFMLSRKAPRPGRWGVVTDLALSGDIYVPSNQIPVEIKNATAEIARQLLVADRTLDNEVKTQGITSIKAGPVALTFKDSVPDPNVIPDAAQYFIPEWWGTLRSVTPSVRGLVRA